MKRYILCPCNHFRLFVLWCCIIIMCWSRQLTLHMGLFMHTFQHMLTSLQR